MSPLFLKKDGPGLGGIKLGKPGRFRNGIVQRSEPVLQAKLPSSPPVPDAALRDLVDTLRCHLARVCNQANKAAVNVLHAGLRQRIEFGTETPRQIRFTRQWRRLYAVRSDADFRERIFKAGQNAENADETGDGGGSEEQTTELQSLMRISNAV